MDYKEANEYLGNLSRRKLANHTYLEYVPFPGPVKHSNGPTPIAVRLHNTNIITFYPSKIILNSGGWQTVTTKDRLNRYLPMLSSILQEKGIWYVCYDKEKVAVFYDGIILSNIGNVPHAGKLEIQKAKVLRLRKRIKAYVTRYIEAFKAGKVPAPSNGDCWYCLMRETQGKGTKTGTLHADGSLTNRATVKPLLQGRTLGELCGDPSDHILSHIKDNYFVPSLLIRAMEVAGCGVGWFWDLQACWQEGKPIVIGGEKMKYHKRWLRRYLYRQLGLVS